MAAIPSNLRQIESLVEIVARLRGPDGCPWDKEQTHESLTQYAIEETHELVEVLEYPSGALKDQKMKEELGDVLFQVVLHAQLASERGAFTLEDVISSISEKLLRRHPHVFGDTKVADSAEVVRNWESIKKAEKAADGSGASASPYALNVPPLPALQRAYKIGKRTEKLQFDWEDAEGAMNKVEEEFAELREAIDEGTDEQVQAELGDVLFSLAQLSRHLDLEPEQILRRGNVKFETRFNKMVELAAADGVDWGSLSMDDKDKYWVKAKEILRGK
ncbi:nucleoside triphosphate pyrophosphohydrolase [Bdellovibrio bacteriovorus]|uniref:Nucleoside triphosphate pyrophosphohydrolase n=1 Tax=Bdellovibrio bacteriovorus TaxID=959 RepID=A0A150WBQ1_BDEBC|nr:nucleoside triphosphate pyrophosphohydrolase [Bdellovibrio bacteriovorus]KYG60302.1 nucleoside triphosphate pyrophosphohydrolase [Bdellovibrio bacteriovorus]